MFAAYSVVLRGGLCRRKMLHTLCRIMKQTVKSKVIYIHLSFSLKNNVTNTRLTSLYG